MKKLLWLVVLMVGTSSLGAFCTNNAPGAKHQKACGGHYAYTCTRKPAEAYGRSTNKFYTGDTCNYCGCSSKAHKRMTS